MTIHKLTAGDGYTYLTRQVAGGDVGWERGQDAADYYTAKGNPPGRWMGRGAPLLELAGQQVAEDQMRALFGSGMHPNADAAVTAYLAEHVRADMTDRQLKALEAGAIRAATLGARFPAYEPLERFDSRVAKRLEVIAEATGREPTPVEVKKVQAEESRRARAAVAGFDVVFAPVKSAALLWALDQRPEVRRAVRHAHEAARDAALEMLEQHAAYTRTGKAGVAQIETRGLVAAVFDHYDSRAGDPNLHTHVAISSKVQGVDGKWRSLDARALYRVTVAASEFYNTAFETELTSRLPVRFAPRADTIGTKEPIREIAGVPTAYIEHFSARRTGIEARYEQLLRQFRREHGHDPSRQVCHHLARQANLDTREGKKTARSLEEMRADWAQSLAEHFGQGAVADLMSVVPGLLPAAPRTPQIQVDTAELADRVVANVAEMRSIWTVWNLRAEAERLARSELVFTSPQEHRAVVAEIVAETLTGRLSISVDGPAPLQEPEALRRSDGTSVFLQHGAARYTSRIVLDAEDRLVAAAQTRTAVGLARPRVAASLEGFDGLGTTLDPGQRQLVTAFACDDRLLVAGLGPAGAGKTTAMRAYAHVAAQGGQRIVALATSSAAADVLGKELGVRADNLHKFLHEYSKGRYAQQLRSGQRVPVWARVFALNPGDVVLLDEAGMAGTLALDRLVRIAARRGAVVRLLGDYRQLGAVESGGALRLIAHEAGAFELTTLYRFRDPAEADATLKLRVGDASGLDFYAANGRIRSGSKQAMIEVAYAAWRADMLEGKTTLMAAASGMNVTALSAQARLDRVEAGQVEAAGIGLHDGNTAGVGDWITTRHNERKLSVHGGRDWVKNGDAWAVTARHDDGSLTVRHLEHHGAVLLPAAYVRANVELLYATTTNRAQGSTVDTAHPLITPEMSRENLYVIASRARERTTLHVVTHELLAYDPDDRVDRVVHDARMYAAREVLENVLGREGNELSATESIRDAADQAQSLATLVPRHQHATAMLASQRYVHIAAETLDPRLAKALIDGPDWPAVVHVLLRAEAIGWQPQRLLAATARDGELLTADTPGRLLAWRIAAHIHDRPVPVPLEQPTLNDTARYAALLRPHLTNVPLDPAEGALPPNVLSARTPDSHRDRTSAETLARYARATATTLGIGAVDVTAHRSWPHLAGALRGAELAGRDVDAFLATLCGRISADDTAERLNSLTRTARRLLRAHGSHPVDLTVPALLEHAQTAAAVLGINAAVHARSEAAWPALNAVLRRAERAGHRPETILRTVAEAREVSTVDSLSEVLAWRLGRYLRNQPEPAPTAESTQRDHQAWRTLAWTLKAFESTGGDLPALVGMHGSDGIHDILNRAQQAARSVPGPASPAPHHLPWLVIAGQHDDRNGPITEYLNAASELITDRIRHLAEAAITASPAWAEPLGPAPQDPAQHAEWIRHIAIIAAYRDQQQIPTDDPRQILGPYTEPGRPEHDAYWHAAHAIATARRLAGLEPHDTPHPDADGARAQIAVDVYLALPEAQRTAVSAAMAERCGDLWFGTRATIDDHAVLQHSTTPDLHNVLVQQGYLGALEPPPNRHSAEANRGREAGPTGDQNRPVEMAMEERRRAQRAAERAARIERAQQARVREHAQQHHRVRPRPQQMRDNETPPVIQPNQQQTQRQEWQFGQ